MEPSREALDVLEVAASIVARATLWTRSARAAYRPSTKHEGHTRTCAPGDERARKWSSMGALELSAPDPDGLPVVLALEELREACRGWSIMAVEDLWGYDATVWAFACAIDRLRRKVERRRVPRLRPLALPEPGVRPAELPLFEADEPSSSGDVRLYGEPVLRLASRRAA